ncbi:tetratricopeptide repeat protein [uncultured Kordia sp.]|uniref:tetratricopeptide repeat protein n=1 Tax=uncultured Kordia sp. TaxID=507699 RepID=UPI002601C4C5|nr:tetratricopeptide repeat protein [uncultured Kordia sp.]
MKYLYTKVFFLLISMLFAINTSAQSRVIDSLETILHNHKKNDSTKVNLLNKLAFKYKSNDINKAEVTVQEANKLAKELGFIRGEARSFLVLSFMHITKAEYDEAENDALQALNLFKSIDNNYGIYSAYNELGSIAAYKNNLEKALAYYKEAYFINEKRGNLKNKSVLMANMGNIAYARGNFNQAIAYYKKAIISSEKGGYVSYTLSYQNNLAVIYGNQGRTLEALKCFHKSLDIYRKEENKKEVASLTNNIGLTYGEREEFDKALPYLEESLKLNRELQDKLGIARNLAGIGAILIGKKKYDKALEYFDEVIPIYEAIDNKAGLMNVYNHIGGIYISKNQPKKALEKYKLCLELSLSLGDQKKEGYSYVSLAEAYLMLKKYDKAIEYGHKGQMIAHLLDILKQQKDVSITLSKAYEATGRYKEALADYKIHKKINDSLFNKDNIEKVTQLEYDYKYKQKLDSAKITELELKKTVQTTTQDLRESQQNLLLGIIVFLVVALLMGTIIFFLKLKSEKAKTQNVIVEQKLLRSQMTPHFIFNSLSVLQGMILNKEEKSSISYLSKFSKLLRTILENSRHKVVSLADELTAINEYMALQNLDVNPPYKYDLKVTSEIDTTALKIPPMLMQPFIENAVEHAFPNQKENKQIEVTLTFEAKKLTCTIVDNGIGINLEKQKNQRNKNSLATKITEERLKVLSKDFKVQGNLSIKNRVTFGEQGTLVTLVIPYKTDLIA